MKHDNKRTGRLGEDLACDYLKKRGYRIEERNFSTRFGEIDMICYQGEILVFVEVKTKIGHEFGEPEEMVNRRKLSRVKKMAQVYLSEKGIDVSCRVDVVAVVLDEEENLERLDHYQAVY